MVFSSLTFLFIFLPIVLIGNRLIPKKYVNVFLLLMSLIFYAWGEPKYIILMVISIMVNWILGCLMEDKPDYKKFILIADIAFNLALLGYFKYFDFFINIVNSLIRGNIPSKNIPLPIGISFYTFQILSYIIDLYFEKYKAQRSIKDLALYICLFPQLIAGPIVRYEDIYEQINNRQCTSEMSADGVKRFIYGLGKKVIIANTLAECLKDIFAINAESLSCSMAWIGFVICMLNIYYDFSGYSDMAIGIGKMLGFEFIENFNYPYLSKSITEYWRRWHISLNVWFREYLFMPFSRSKFLKFFRDKIKDKKKRRLFTPAACTLVVFAFTGLWHGASYGFVVWGIFHGILMIIEQLGFSKFLEKHKIFGHIYTLLAVGIGLIIFEDGLSRGIPYLKVLFTPWINPSYDIYTIREIVDNRTIVFIIIGILGCGFFKPVIDKMRAIKYSEYYEILWCALLMLVSITMLASGTYNPFIYFRF